MHKLIVTGLALLVTACGGNQNAAYDQARTQYEYCLSLNQDCSRAERQYLLMANDRMLRQNDAAIAQQVQANTSAWGRWAMNRRW